MQLNHIILMLVRSIKSFLSSDWTIKKATRSGFFYGEWLVYQALLLFPFKLPMLVWTGKMEFTDNS